MADQVKYNVPLQHNEEGTILLHHTLIDPEASLTKCQIVFNASAVGAVGRSLIQPWDASQKI
jgi:hypothetical protein